MTMQLDEALKQLSEDSVELLCDIRKASENPVKFFDEFAILEALAVMQGEASEEDVAKMVAHEVTVQSDFVRQLPFVKAIRSSMRGIVKTIPDSKRVSRFLRCYATSLGEKFPGLAIPSSEVTEEFLVNLEKALSCQRQDGTTYADERTIAPLPEKTIIVDSNTTVPDVDVLEGGQAVSGQLEEWSGMVNILTEYDRDTGEEKKTALVTRYCLTRSGEKDVRKEAYPLLAVHKDALEVKTPEGPRRVNRDGVILASQKVYESEGARDAAEREARELRQKLSSWEIAPVPSHEMILHLSRDVIEGRTEKWPAFFEAWRKNGNSEQKRFVHMVDNPLTDIENAEKDIGKFLAASSYVEEEAGDQHLEARYFYLVNKMPRRQVIKLIVAMKENLARQDKETASDYSQRLQREVSFFSVMARAVKSRYEDRNHLLQALHGKDILTHTDLIMALESLESSDHGKATHSQGLVHAHA